MPILLNDLTPPPVITFKEDVIRAIDTLNALTSVNYHVAGGAALAYRENVHFSDIDVYLESVEDFNTLRTALIDVALDEHETDNAITFKYSSQSKIVTPFTFQLIKTVGKIDEIVETFDLSASCLYIDKYKTLTECKDFNIENTFLKEINASSIVRYLKYANRLKSSSNDFFDQAKPFIDNLISKIHDKEVLVNSDGVHSQINSLIVLTKILQNFPQLFDYFYDEIIKFYEDEELIEIFFKLWNTEISINEDNICDELIVAIKQRFDLFEKERFFAPSGNYYLLKSFLEKHSPKAQLKYPELFI